MKNVYAKNRYMLKRGIADFFTQNKTILIVFFLVIILCFFTALFTAIKAASGLTLFNLADKSLKSFLKGETSLWGLWFAKFISYCFYGIVIYFCRFNKYFIIFDLILVGYICFMLTINACVLIIIYGLSAVLYALLIYFAFSMTLLLLLIIFMCQIKSTKNKYLSNKVYVSVWLLPLIMLIILTLQVLLTPFFTAPIIVII